MTTASELGVASELESVLAGVIERVADELSEDSTGRQKDMISPKDSDHDGVLDEDDPDDDNDGVPDTRDETRTPCDH
jgi:hypothetical protein